MTTVPQPSFEIVHLVSTLLVRFNWICKKCKLDVQQLYVLAYIKYHGQVTTNGKKVILRGDITRLLKKVFKSNDNQVYLWVTKLCSENFLAEVTLDQSLKAKLFSSRRGRKALVLNRKGIAKVSSYLTELEGLRNDIANKAHFLQAPGMDSYGTVCEGIFLFLSMLQPKNKSE